MDKAAKTLEVHTHHYTSGGKHGEFSHSHEGGNRPHEHTHTGPSCYTICRKQWLAQTGLRGGGTKKYTVKPSGIQLEARYLTREECTFELHIVGQPMPERGDGPGISLPLRLVLENGLICKVVNEIGAA